MVGTDMKKYFGVKSKVAIQINDYQGKLPQLLCNCMQKMKKEEMISNSFLKNVNII